MLRKLFWNHSKNSHTACMPEWSKRMLCASYFLRSTKEKSLLIIPTTNWWRTPQWNITNDKWKCQQKESKLCEKCQELIFNGNFFFLCNRNVEKETSLNFTGQKSTHRTDSLRSCGGLFNNKSSLDSSDDDPMQLGASLLSFNEMQVDFHQNSLFLR